MEKELIYEEPDNLGTVTTTANIELEECSVYTPNLQPHPSTEPESSDADEEW